MKKAIMTVVFICVATVIAYAALATWVFHNQTFTTSEAAGHDTSALINLRSYQTAELVASVTGTDSVKLKTYIDGYFNGKYYLDIYDDSLIIDNGSGNYTEGYLLRGYGTNNIKGYELIRVRVDVSSGAADDSSSALSYSMKILGR